jgi:hypothetical protein
MWLRVGLELISNNVERYILFVVDEGSHLIQSLKSLFPSSCSQWLFVADPSSKNPFWIIVLSMAIAHSHWKLNEPTRF